MPTWSRYDANVGLKINGINSSNVKALYVVVWRAERASQTIAKPAPTPATAHLSPKACTSNLQGGRRIPVAASCLAPRRQDTASIGAFCWVPVT